jgi:Kef-type K+ transport system membrane component KefB
MHATSLGTMTENERTGLGARGIGVLPRYALLVGAPVVVLAVALVVGAGLSAPGEAPSPGPAAPAGVASAYSLVRLLLQVVLIVATARLVGKAFRLLRQPQVVGEMAAGLLLGPSLFGAASPALFAMVFPAQSLDFLQALSHLGLLVFMFLVGLELDLGVLRGRGRAAVTISHTSIAVPFAMGTILALWLYPRASTPGVGFVEFALFVGTAMSITAFPVLARILTERRLLATPIGALTLACAAIDDVTAWSILAGVVLLVRSSHSAVPLWLTVGGTLAFVALMAGVVRPLLARAAGRGDGRLTHDRLALVLMVVLVSALATEALGIHALFGAFLAGTVMPRSPGFAGAIAQRLEDVTVVLLLPLFFAFTGLRTRVELMSGGESWLILLAVVGVAIAGKLGGSAVAARVAGMSWRDSLLLGTLMNTRGLMELVALNVGLEIGVISPRLFTIMVLMALVTTFMTTPLVALLQPAVPHADPDTAPTIQSAQM